MKSQLIWEQGQLCVNMFPSENDKMTNEVYE